jgi:hypothetical protein
MIEVEFENFGHDALLTLLASVEAALGAKSKSLT